MNGLDPKKGASVKSVAPNFRCQASKPLVRLDIPDFTGVEKKLRRR